jgi:hypothetical protein
MKDVILSAIARAVALCANGDAIKSMQDAIDEGYASSDPAIRAQWESLPFERRPTPEELMEYLAENKK